MFAGILGFEWRYQRRNPVLWVAIILFFLLAFGATSVEQIRIGSGGNVHKNAPFAIAQMMQILTVFYMFVATAFVANVVVRDDDTGFGPIVRATRVTKSAYLFGRFGGAFLAAAIGFLAVPLGIWIGSLMPWVDPEILGPNRFSYYASAYIWLALPNVLLTSAMFFALATMTRSMMATYVGVIAFLILFFIAGVVLDRNPAYELIGAYSEPFSIGASSYLTKYWTAADRNTLTIPLTGMVLWNRLIVLGVAALALGLAYARFGFSVRPSKKALKAAKAAAAVPETADVPRLAGPLPAPRYDRATAWTQLVVRTRLEMAQVFKSPAYVVLLALGLFNAMASLVDLGEVVGTPVLPVTRVVIDLLRGTFGIIPIIIATYYAGELVWRERDRKTHEIIDASAIPDWAFVVPKAAAVTLVLLSTLLVSVVGGMVMQLVHGYTDFEPGKYLLWYVLPETVDVTLIAVLAVFLQALSPHKFVGWGLMLVYVVGRATLSNLGFGDALYNYGQGPGVPLSDMNGQGKFLDRRLVAAALLVGLRGAAAGARAWPVAARHRNAAVAAPAPAAAQAGRAGGADRRGCGGGVRGHRHLGLHQYPCLERLSHADQRRARGSRL
ncbi:hypothetical protein [Sphingomonas sp. R1]|uniref:hypothetical protein n=1 Tax=Sphingomonas sp. R1 TaxID=399176 RepID=UPI0029CAB39D|nr:hypothetical protein [Sphingomonas sp. R1]